MKPSRQIYILICDDESKQEIEHFIDTQCTYKERHFPVIVRADQVEDVILDRW